MTNWIVSNIRTLVPVLIGTAVTWIAKETGIVIDESTSSQVIVAATGAVISAYYFVVHWLEQHFPKFGWLLGMKSLPYYNDAEGG